MPCGNHFKYADTMSGQVDSNLSYAIYIPGSLIFLFFKEGPGRYLR